MVGVLAGIETAGEVVAGTPGVTHTVSVTITVTGESHVTVHAATKYVNLDYKSVISSTYSRNRGQRRRRSSLQ